MNPRERGFLLLTSHLGNPDRKVLTTAQLRTLAERMRKSEQPSEDREMQESDLISLGYSREKAAGILHLLAEEELLRHYCTQAEKNGYAVAALGSLYMYGEVKAALEKNYKSE